MRGSDAIKTLTPRPSRVFGKTGHSRVIWFSPFFMDRHFPSRKCYRRLQALSGAVPHAVGTEIDSFGFAN